MKKNLKIDSKEMQECFEEILANPLFSRASLSGRRKKGGGNIEKATVRLLLVKGKIIYQLTERREKQDFHKNLSQNECIAWLRANICHFKQCLFYAQNVDYHLLQGKKGDCTLLKKKPVLAKDSLQSSRDISKPHFLLHNRKKEYLIEEGTPIPFLVYLGVMNKEGKVYPAKQDKFRQINRFLEMIEDIYPHLKNEFKLPLRIIDFGCGKAYLTFALYHYFKEIKKVPVHLTGIDLKDAVIQDCQAIASALNLQKDLHFVKGNIESYQLVTQEHAEDEKVAVDLVVSLHACDTATDAALEKAICWKARVILCVPCCQHELLEQINHEALHPLLKHGILKERFASLVTDAARVQLLDVLGYRTQIIEFIDLEHTPKNLLIRAIR